MGALAARVRPALEALGEYAPVSDELHRLVREGNGAMRQVRAWRQRKDAADVITEAAAATLR